MENLFNYFQICSLAFVPFRLCSFVFFCNSCYALLDNVWALFSLSCFVPLSPSTTTSTSVAPKPPLTDMDHFHLPNSFALWGFFGWSYHFLMTLGFEVTAYHNYSLVSALLTP